MMFRTKGMGRIGAAILASAIGLTGLGGCNSQSGGGRVNNAGATTGAPSAAGSPFGSTGTSSIPQSGHAGATSGATTQ